MANIIRDLGSLIQQSTEFKFKDFDILNDKSPKGRVDKAAVENSISNLFAWSKNQRIRLPQYGLDLRRYVYEPVNRITANRIGEEVSRSFELYCERVELVEIFVTPNADTHTFEIEIQYTIPSLPGVGKLTFNKTVLSRYNI